MTQQDKTPLLDDIENYPKVEEERSSEEGIHTRPDGDGTSSLSCGHHRQPCCSWRWSLFHFVIFLVYSIFFWTTTLHHEHKCDSISKSDEHLIYSPAIADGAVRHVTSVVDGLVQDSVLGQRPSNESEAAWHQLMKGINLRITNEEMDLLGGKKSLKLADGSGYLGTLGVYHELHCIKRLRKYFYKDHYYPNMTWEQEQERITHAEHCLELIRQAAICHGDVSVTAFEWLGDGRQVEPTTQEGTIHRCVDWSALSSWAEARAVNLFDPDLLERPERSGNFTPGQDT